MKRESSRLDRPLSSLIRSVCRTLCFMALLSGIAVPAGRADQPRVLILAASSAGPALTAIAEDYSRRTGTDVRVSTGSSGTLARQITQGAPADLYVSAAQQWTETLLDGQFLNARFTTDLLRNRIILISPRGQDYKGLLNLDRPADVLSRLAGGRLAIGDPRHVPAGQYAQQAFESIGLWPAVRDRLARQINVRAVLAFVERGESSLGAIYATDFALSDAVQIAAIVPPEAHDPILYAVSIVAGRERPNVIDFYDALRSSRSAEVFADFGFGVVNESASSQTSKTLPSNP